MNNLRKFVFPLLGIVLIYAGWRAYGWLGVAIVVTGLVTWALLHVSRMIAVLGKAASRPKGYVPSAVMLNAKLKPKATLLHVMAMTKSIGEALTEPDAQPEIFRWTDEGGSHVTCEFADGKLMKWSLWRPPVEEESVVAENVNAGTSGTAP